MSLTFARFLKQEWDAWTVAMTSCPACGARAGAHCRRRSTVRATPCPHRQDHGDTLRLTFATVGYLRAVEQSATKETAA